MLEKPRNMTLILTYIIMMILSNPKKILESSPVGNY